MGQGVGGVQHHELQRSGLFAPGCSGDERRGIAAISTYPVNLETIARLESERTGWFSFDWLVFNRDLAAFREQYDAAGITWCPDFGSWPEDSRTCSTP